MTTIELINQIFNLCVIPLLGILTTFIVQIIRVKMEEIAVKSDSEFTKKYIDMLTETIINCVTATNQTYVAALKEKGEFGIEAQKEAFQKTYNQVMLTLKSEAYNYLREIYNDVDGYIKTMIEAEVNRQKAFEAFSSSSGNTEE